MFYQSLSDFLLTMNNKNIMPPKQAEKKRRNKRKARTEVSPSSSSSESEASEPQQEPKSTQTKTQAQAREEKTALNSDSDSTPIFSNSQKKTKPDPETSFEDFYLRQATREFANDLDKLRSAGDFNNEKSIPLLISALKQGTKCFSAEERRMVGEMVADK